MSTLIRIGTRESQLALWQANTVKRALEQNGHTCQLVPISSKGDQDLTTPLYALGITGVFTKTLDIALLENKIDIAVHSMKDVPTLLPTGIVKGAVLKRGLSQDVLLYKNLDFLESFGTIATGSLRRKAQWLNKYPKHSVVGLRGNVNTRLEKLANNPWNGAIFAKAGLDRINLLPENCIDLDWMTPAPSQGAVMVVCQEDAAEIQHALKALNHTHTNLCTQVEREFLRVLEGGCTAPIGALAQIDGNFLEFKGELLALDGSQKIEIHKRVTLDNIQGLGRQCAMEILNQGGTQLMQQINSEL